LVGAPTANGTKGEVYTMVINTGSSVYALASDPIVSMVPRTIATSSAFGFSVALSSVSNTAFVGAPTYGLGTTTASGTLFSFSQGLPGAYYNYSIAALIDAIAKFLAAIVIGVLVIIVAIGVCCCCMCGCCKKKTVRGGTTARRALGDEPF